MGTYWEIVYSGHSQRGKMEHFGKIIVVFDNFLQKSPS